MKLYSKGGDLAFKAFTFPDGQRHIEVPFSDDPCVTIEARIANADDLQDVLLAKSALDTYGCYVDLNIRYLMGARMDRRIGVGHPNTLEIVCQQIMHAGFSKIRVLDPHSYHARANLRAEGVLPLSVVKRLLKDYHPEHDVIIIPDVGATERVQQLVYGENFRQLQGRKHRTSDTGALSSFSVDDVSAVSGKGCLVIDDICDGGGTFSGLSDVLMNAGASYVDLFVTHGIFSKGTPLPGIRNIYATDSYCDHAVGVMIWPFSMGNV